MKTAILLFASGTLLIHTSVFSQCEPGTAHNELDINNVRARMNMGGSNWWDTQSVPKYEVPKGSGKHSFFANAFWIGGLNDTGGVHVAATRFRQVGEDFWPGPLNVAGEIDSSACDLHNRIYKLNRWQVDEFRHRFNEPGYVIPSDILEWPTEGNPYTQANAKAPFRDVNNDGVYNPMDGDYPAFAFNEAVNKNFHLLGDQCLWWVENDKGNLHTETGAEPLGVELQVMAYAYATCNELNDQTFYRYKAINKSPRSYSETYTAVWVDADVGFAEDDFVQCDVMRHLGFAYNGLVMDGTGGPTQYGENPPAAGVGILQGPRAPLSDGVDNNRDGVVDEIGERLMMSHFVYHNNTGGGGNPAQTDPQTGIDYYNYMRGIWLDGAPMCYGVNGHPSSGCDSGTPCDFMFPGDSDPLGYGTGGVPMWTWTEQTAGNVPFDRRFLVSTGPFDFNSGDTVNFHYGALWARDYSNASNPFTSAEKLFEVKDFCQEQFDLNFQSMECCPPTAEIHLLQPIVNQFMFSSIYEADEYFWDFGNGLTSNERFPETTFYLDFDVYDVQLIVENECGSDTAVIQVSRQFFDVPELEPSQINVYPNPSSDHLFIQAETNLRIQALKVYDIRGRELFNRKLQGVSSYVLRKNFLPGVYTLLIQSSKGIVRKRVVIN